MASTSTLLGAAGEYYVMSQLLRRGLIAALAPVGVPHADIVVTDDVGDRLCAVQVKARVANGSDGGWHMRAKHESISSPYLYYVFVDFGPTLDDKPKCYVIPSLVVSEVIRSSHALWLATPGKRGQPHKDGELRRMLPDFDRVGLRIGRGEGWLNEYLENWTPLRERWDERPADVVAQT